MPKPTHQELEAILATLPRRSLNSTLFNIANAYAQAGDLAMAAIGTSGNADFVSPAIMCKSFCVELLLKFFVAVAHPAANTKKELDARGVNLHGHKYSDLYDRIAEKTRSEIAASFSTVVGRQVDHREFRRILQEDLGDDSFVSWRYVYEHESIRHLDPVLWDQVVLALGKAAERERKGDTGHLK